MTLSGQKKEGRFSLFAKHAIKYYIVGASGVLVNLGFLYFLTEFVGMWYFVSYSIAILVSITTNFIFNKLWTFRDSTNSQKTMIMYLKFVSVSLVGMGIQLGSVYLFVEVLGIYYMLAALFSIGLASGINFMVNRHWTFGIRF